MTAEAPMMPMRERIARRIEPNSWQALGRMADTLAHKNRRTSSLRKADAILEEFREPTEAMTQGGVEACAYHGAIVEMDVLSAWRGMIDKAKDER